MVEFFGSYFFGVTFSELPSWSNLYPRLFCGPKDTYGLNHVGQLGPVDQQREGAFLCGGAFRFTLMLWLVSMLETKELDESRKRVEARQLDLGRLVGARKARARTEIGGYRGIHRALPANCC